MSSSGQGPGVGDQPFLLLIPNPDEPEPKTISSQGSGIGDQGEKWLSPDP